MSGSQSRAAQILDNEILSTSPTGHLKVHVAAQAWVDKTFRQRQVDPKIQYQRFCRSADELEAFLEQLGGASFQEPEQSLGE